MFKRFANEKSEKLSLPRPPRPRLKCEIINFNYCCNFFCVLSVIGERSKVDFFVDYAIFRSVLSLSVYLFSSKKVV